MHLLNSSLFSLIPLIAAVTFGSASETISPENEENYQLRPVDKVEIIVYGQEDLSSVQRINGEGKVTVPLIGQVQMAGLTTHRAEAMIEARFIQRKLLRDPDVSINVVAYSERAITVLGQVHRPGQIILRPEANGTSLSSAIAAAGGFTRLANIRKIKVVRNDRQGDRHSWEVDLKDALDAEEEAEPFFLLPGDTVYVKERIW